MAAQTTPAPKTSTTEVAVVPTPAPQLCPTPGVYTFPATTITVDKTTTVCGASTTSVSKGTHTLGGATTAVTGATTITVPYATVKTTEGVTTSTIDVTTTFCPAAGTYTVGKHTTVVTEDSTIAVPSITSYLPGTYTRPEVTTTITKTSDVVYCPYEAVKPTQPATSAPAPKPVVPTTVVPAAPVNPIPTKATVYSAVPQVPASSAKPSPSAVPSTTPPKGNGKAPWAMTYTPYAQSGQCKSKNDVMKDVEALVKAGITTLRTYSTDCDTLPNVGAACKAYGCKMIIGIFIDAPHCSANNPTVSEQISAIKNWAQFDLVEIISVGNEAMLNGYCTAGEIAGLISTCKSTFTGYTGGYTTADTVAAWQMTGVAETLCGVVEYPAANIHPFFNTQTVASQAGVFVKSQMEILAGICGKPGKCYETGWPSQGKCMGSACPGKVEQETAVTAILKECPKDIVLFSLEDDLWKSDQTECACEKSWGCKDILKSVINLSL